MPLRSPYISPPPAAAPTVPPAAAMGVLSRGRRPSRSLEDLRVLRVPIIQRLGRRKIPSLEFMARIKEVPVVSCRTNYNWYIINFETLTTLFLIVRDFFGVSEGRVYE